MCARYGASPTPERVVFAGKVVTGAGVSAGIDLALALAARLQGPEVAQAIQLGIEMIHNPLRLRISGQGASGRARPGEVGPALVRGSMPRQDPWVKHE